ncbi:MAG: redoxin family protein [Nevskiales bacterium]
MRIRLTVYFCAAVATLIVLRAYWLTPAQAVSVQNASLAPAFTHRDADDWINSRPLTWKDLQGHVVLLDFWTFACWNCYRSIPWLHTVEDRFGPKGLRVVGVHTPELPHEYLRGNVLEKIVEFKLTHPVMLDNDHSYWKAIGNRYWPTFYLVDRRGRLRSVYYGETHAGDSNAQAMEAAIEKLLAEPA